MEELRHIIREALLESKRSDRTVYDDIEGYISQKLSRRDNINGGNITYYNIYDEKGHELGTLDLNGNLRYIVDKNGNLGTFEGDYKESSKNFSIRNGLNSRYLDVKQAVRWLWIKNHTPLQENVERTEDFALGRNILGKVYFKRIGYWARLQSGRRPAEDREKAHYYWEIFESSSHQLIGRIWEDKKIQFKKAGEDQFGGYNDNWGLKDFSGGLKEAVRYIWLKRQKMKPEVNENVNKVQYDKIVYPDIENWYAEVGYPNYNRTVVIYDNTGHNVGMIGFAPGGPNRGQYQLSYDDGSGNGREYTNEILWKYGKDDIKKAVRYVWLKNQKPKEQEVVDEITTNGEGDLENYYNENPAALNNDYVDNYIMGIDDRGFYQNTKISKSVPDSW